MNENKLAIVLREVEPDPTALIFLLVKPSQPADIPTPPFELVHIARIRNYYHLPHFDDKFNQNLLHKIREVENHTGATKHLLIIREDWEEILNGKDPWHINRSLSLIQFKPVDMTDIFGEENQFRTVELSR